MKWLVLDSVIAVVVVGGGLIIGVARTLLGMDPPSGSVGTDSDAAGYHDLEPGSPGRDG